MSKICQRGLWSQLGWHSNIAYATSIPYHIISHMLYYPKYHIRIQVINCYIIPYHIDIAYWDNIAINPSTSVSHHQNSTGQCSRSAWSWHRRNETQSWWRLGVPAATPATGEWHFQLNTRDVCFLYVINKCPELNQEKWELKLCSHWLYIYIFTVINKFEPNNFTDMHLNIAPDTWKQNGVDGITGFLSKRR